MKKTEYRVCKICGDDEKYYCKGMCKSCYKKALIPSRWCRISDACVRCGKSDSPHQARGLCAKCYRWLDTDVLCACGCGLPVPRIGNKVKKFRKGHWLRIQGEGSAFQKAHKERFTGSNNPQYGKFGKDHPAYGHETKPEVRELRRKTILRTLSEGKMGKTDIEVILSEILDELGVKHISQALLYDKFTVDEYLPEGRVIIEAFGEYWHGDRRRFKRLNHFQMANFKRDESKGKWLTNKGHRVLILWEKELKKDREWCRQEILLAIENSTVPFVQDSV